MAQNSVVFFSLLGLLALAAPLGWTWVTTQGTPAGKRSAFRISGALLMTLVGALLWFAAPTSWSLRIAGVLILLLAILEIWQARVCGSCSTITKAQGMTPAEYCRKCGSKLVA
jgi:hypothetical protein